MGKKLPRHPHLKQLRRSSLELPRPKYEIREEVYGLELQLKVHYRHQVSICTPLDR